MKATFSKKRLNLTLMIIAAMSVVFACSLGSCSMMEEDRDDCPYGLYVRFKYDYNVQRADLFADHAGSVTLYVYDEAGRFVMSRTVSKENGLTPFMRDAYLVHITELPAGRYHLMAVAEQKKHEDALASKGAKFRYDAPSKGDDMTNFGITLDRASAPDAAGRYAVSTEVPLDTLWHGIYTSDESVFSANIDKNFDSTLPADERKYGATVTIEDQVPTYATISMMRDTKNLNIVLRQAREPQNISSDEYSVELTVPNGKINYDNSLASDDKLLYRPYAEWDTAFGTDGSQSGTAMADESGVIERAAHYDLSFPRLMNYPVKNDERSARLKIIRKKTGKAVVDIDLPYIFVDGRSSFETINYTPQQYLDREYDYRLDFFLEGEQWRYVYITVGVLGWRIQVQNENL